MFVISFFGKTTMDKLLITGRIAQTTLVLAVAATYFFFFLMKRGRREEIRYSVGDSIQTSLCFLILQVPLQQPHHSLRVYNSHKSCILRLQHKDCTI